MEPVAASFFTFGLFLLVASWIMLIITSFREDYNWGLTTLFLPPLSYLYSFWAWEKTRSSIILAAIGCLMLLFGV